jgi:CRISPR type III-B/RAMP module-associated protein Cmr3
LHYSSFYGSFITYEVYQDYLRNGKPDWVLQRGKDFFYISDMADWDGRTGNKIDSVSGCVEEGQLYHLNLLHLKKDFCFFAQIDGDNDFLDKNVFITLGGERRRCFIEKTEPIFFGSLRTGNKLVFISPAAFADSEKPFGVPADMALIPGYVSRAGYNIAMNHPKPLQRLVPAGAVYWFSEGFSLSEKIVNDICDFEQGFGSFLLAGGRK